ncbi:hypothetical protein CJP74_04610 [Psittacicella melopsittaci]|uniref:Aminotransferase n=1 Tax=Psittacicella melopsittaci TaxID=2028576 RepID=A0A3A1Y8H5_9GAMM|nr:aromatic amino acid transaminase [Psittacicella melopsittaci]RIY32417.1 hypothetical protein CJP74_04610 [Psittacicella melopsittaci]
MDFFSDITLAADDPILALVQQYLKDTRPNKVDLSVGVYYNPEGKQENFEAVRVAQKAVAEYLYALPTEAKLEQVNTDLAKLVAKDTSESYLPATGYKGFNLAVRDLVFPADLPARQEDRIQSIETVAGSGGLRLVGDFIHKQLGLETIYISNPTWSNHFAIFEHSGLKTAEYSYYNPATKALDVEATLADLDKLTAKDAVLLQAACHNPTGYDFTPEEWKLVLNKIKEKGALPVFDFAYQGFGDGLDEDAYAVRLASEIFAEALVISSCSKNLGLYGDRLGAIHVIAANANEANLAVSNLQSFANNYYVSPGTNGAFVATTVLNNPELRSQWENDLAQVRSRIKDLRTKLANALKARGFDFDFVVKQKGMFSYTGFTPEQCKELKEKYAIYIVGNGRINIVGLNDNNLEYVADAFAAVLSK